MLGIVALLALLSIIIGATSVLTLRQTLTSRLDQQLSSAVKRSQTFAPPLDRVDDERAPGTGDAQSAGTLGLIVLEGQIVSPRYLDDDAVLRTLSESAQETLLAVDSTTPVTVQLGGELGSYRVIRAETAGEYTLIVGLPLREVDATTAQLAWIIAAVATVGIALAAAAGMFVVRVALRPLGRVVNTATRVAELELDRGEVALAERVPASDANSSTEVGQVGAALNRLLEHVASALSARQASESKVRQFVADASHELRTPLASIRGYSELTRRGGHTLPPDIVTALSRIESESVRMTELVEELLLLARLDEGTELHAEPCDLAAVVSDAVNDARAASPDHEWVPAESPAIEIMIDRARVHQALANLLANARTHTPQGTVVTTTIDTCEVDGLGECAVLTVSDNGPGVDPALVPTLFARFVRGDSSRSRAAGSTGLGLAIAKAIAEAHGGRISVESEPGNTRFSLTLPFAEPA